MKLISNDDLKLILQQHRIWVASNKTKGSRADLSLCDLKGFDLRKADGGK